MIPMILYPHPHGVNVVCPNCGVKNKIPPQPAELIAIADAMILLCCGRLILDQDKIEDLKQRLSSFAFDAKDTEWIKYLDEVRE